MYNPGSKIRLLAVLLAILLLPSLTGCGRGEGSVRSLSVSGSTTILPIAEVAAESFQAGHDDTRVLVSGVGSSAGIESVSQGSCDIGTSSRDLKPEEEKLGLVDTPIAYDAVAVIVNPANPVRNLTMAQVKGIFEGRIRNWREVGGPDMPIGLVNRDEASGTREAFGKIALEGDPFDPEAAVLPGTGQVRSVVAGAKGAIGYISVGFITPEVRAMPINGVTPSAETAISGAYPIRRVLHMLTKGAPKGVAKEYIDYVLSREIQTRVVADAGYVPITGSLGPGGGVQ